MLARQKQVVEAYERVQDFLTANPAPTGSDYGEPKAMLDDVVSRLRALRSNQAAGGRISKQETKVQRQLRTKLRNLHLRPISKIAKARLPEAPGIERALKMPEAEISTTKLIDEAHGMRNAAAPYVAEFVKYGRPGDFLERLDAAIDTLRGSLLGKARTTGITVGATAGLEQEIQRGRTAVEILAKWRMARRIKAIPGGTSTTDGDALTGATPNAPAPTPAKVA
jgi:hypothetical protein